MSEREKPPRLGVLRGSKGNDGKKQILGFLQEGRFGMELQFVTPNPAGQWPFGRAIKYANGDGSGQVVAELPKWPCALYLDDGVRVEGIDGNTVVTMAEGEEDTRGEEGFGDDDIPF